jgi:hypothetical protein
MGSGPEGEEDRAVGKEDRAMGKAEISLRFQPLLPSPRETERGRG